MYMCMPFFLAFIEIGIDNEASGMSRDMWTWCLVIFFFDKSMISLPMIGQGDNSSHSFQHNNCEFWPHWISCCMLHILSKIPFFINFPRTMYIIWSCLFKRDLFVCIHMITISYCLSVSNWIEFFSLHFKMFSALWTFLLPLPISSPPTPPPP